jgi:hypothetical protein
VDATEGRGKGEAGSACGVFGQAGSLLYPLYASGSVGRLRG